MARITALAMAAFLSACAEGNGNFGGIAPSVNVVAGTEVTGVTGSDAYPVVRNDEAVGVAEGNTITRNNNGIHQSLNSVPPGFAGSGSSLAPNGATTGFAAAPGPVVAGGTLPTNGSDGIVQTANSLPVGFQDGNGNPAIAFANAAAAHAAAAHHSPHG